MPFFFRIIAYVVVACSNATQDLGCSSASCLADFRKRRGAFADYPKNEPLDLVGIINCPGCPTLTGKVVIGTHQENITVEEYRERVKNLFNQPKKTMVDLILNRDK